MLTVCSVAKATINPVYQGETVRRISMGSKPPVYLRLSQKRDSDNAWYMNEYSFIYASKDSSVEYRWASGCVYNIKSNSLDFKDFEFFFIY